jgi:hypothetical protein
LTPRPHSPATHHGRDTTCLPSNLQDRDAKQSRGAGRRSYTLRIPSKGGRKQRATSSVLYNATEPGLRSPRLLETSTQWQTGYNACCFSPLEMIEYWRRRDWGRSRLELVTNANSSATIRTPRTAGTDPWRGRRSISFQGMMLCCGFLLCSFLRGKHELTKIEFCSYRSILRTPMLHECALSILLGPLD